MSMSADGEAPAVVAAAAAPMAVPIETAGAAGAIEEEVVREAAVTAPAPQAMEEGVVMACVTALAPQAAESEAVAAAEVVPREAGARPKGLVLVPPGHHFWHRACSMRTFGLLAAYAAMALAGWALATHVQVTGSKMLGMAILTVGPTAIILTTFYLRYRIGATKRQTLITFCEAIFWMVPLILLVTFIDPLNTKLTMPMQEVSCTWSEGNGTGLLATLSELAQCSEWASHPERVTPLEQVYIESCPVLQQGKTTTKVVVDSSGSFVPEVLTKYLELYPPALQCPKLEAAMKDLPQSSLVRVSGVGQGSCSLPIETRDTLAAAAFHMREEPCDGKVTLTFGLRPTTIAHSFVTAYIRAGFLEELLKYFAVRRILFKDRVVGAGGLIVYGLAAGAGFATAENAQYTMAGGVDVAMARMVLSIPLHCCTGLIIGIQLGYRKFLGRAFPCPLTLLIPVLVHGTYDFVLMLPASVPLPQDARVPIVAAILVASFVYCRCMWLRLEDVCVSDVRALQAAGLVSAPKAFCCECDCCTPIFVHKDPMVAHAPEQTPPEEGIRRSASRRVAELARTLSESVVPSLPPCQTEPVRCPGCAENVWAQVFFPSFCPHCGERMRNELRPRPGMEEHAIAHSAV